MKALMIASVASMIDQFNMDNIAILEALGYEVQVAANFIEGSSTGPERVQAFRRELNSRGIAVIDIPFNRNPLDKGNVQAYRQVKELIEAECYSLVHCHSPVGGALTRLACRKARKRGTKVIYTAHGFHFYKGAPLLNWLIYYPVECWLARYTDVLITINKEDYARAQKFKAGRVEYVPGVGIDTKRFSKRLSEEEFRAKREELGLRETDIVLLSVGELNENKNHAVLIKAISQIKDQRLKCLIVGKGRLAVHLQNLIKETGLQDRVKLLGFRSDIAQLCNIADVFVFPSFREGLPVALMEAMAAGLPAACSDIRGNTDLIENGKGGLLVKPEETDGIERAIRTLADNPALRNKMGETNREMVAAYDLAAVRERMEHIYKGTKQNAYR